MNKAIGLLELKSVPIGILAADDMLKAADVELLMASPVCPGKYIVIISGKVGPVQRAIESGRQAADVFLIESSVINNISPSVIPAISGLAMPDKMKSLGMLESISALTCIVAADTAVKTSDVELVDLRIARGLGGKSFVIFTGEVSSVRSAMDSCLSELQAGGTVTSHSIIAAPHPSISSCLG